MTKTKKEGGGGVRDKTEAYLLKLEIKLGSDMQEV